MSHILLLDISELDRNEVCGSLLCFSKRERAEEEAEAERLAAAAKAEIERLEKEKLAAAQQEELDRLAAETAAKKAELERMEQLRVANERTLAEAEAAAAKQRDNIEIAMAASNDALADDNIVKAEEGVTDHSSDVVAPVEQRSEEQTVVQTATWWRRNRCRFTSLLLLLLIIGGVVGAVVGLLVGGNDDDNERTSSSSASGSGGVAVASDDPIPVVVDRTCRYEKSWTVYVSAPDNGVPNMMWGVGSDFDGDAVVDSYNEDGMGAIWALSKDGTSWSASAFQTNDEDQLGWDMAIRVYAVKSPFDYTNGVRGTVYVYKLGTDGKYQQVSQLSTPEGTQISQTSGSALTFLDDFLIVGSGGSKKAYVFKRTASGGFQKTTDLTASDASSSSIFGISVDGRGSEVLIRDCEDDTAYLFSYQGDVWKERAKFDGCNASLSSTSNTIVAQSRSDFKASGGRYGGPVDFYDLVCEAV